MGIPDKSKIVNEQTVFWVAIDDDFSYVVICVVIKKLYTNVHARLVVDGELTIPFEYNSGVKQGCKLASTLYGIYAAVLLWLAYKDINHTHSIKVRFRYDGDLIDLRRLKSKTKVLVFYIREAQYADDVAIFSDTPAGLQILHRLQCRSKKDESVH